MPASTAEVEVEESAWRRAENVALMGIIGERSRGDLGDREVLELVHLVVGQGVGPDGLDEAFTEVCHARKVTPEMLRLREFIRRALLVRPVATLNG